MNNFKDLTNKKFGCLTPIEYLGNSKWKCKCDCGNIRIVNTGTLNAGKAYSCGCKDSRKKYQINKDYFKEINTQEKAYTLGFIAADGSINLKNNLLKIDQKTENEDILYKIANSMEYNNSIKHYTQHTNFCKEGYDIQNSRLNISNKEIVKDIQKYGITPNKSNSLKLNFDLIPKEFIKDCLRGLFEGDGSYSITKIKGHKEYSYNISLTSSTIMINKIKEILIDIFPDIQIYVYHRKQNLNNASLLIRNKKDIYNILHYLYNNATIYQNIKYNKVNDILNNIKKGGGINE